MKLGAKGFNHIFVGDWHVVAVACISHGLLKRDVLRVQRIFSVFCLSYYV